MITLQEYRNTVDPLMRLETQLAGKLRNVRNKLKKIRSKNEYVCNRCKNVFTKKELGYRKYLVRSMDMRCQPMGDYDQKQIETIQHILCCPICGRTFNEVIHEHGVWMSNTYGRYDNDERNFKHPLTCKKLQSKEIFKQ